MESIVPISTSTGTIRGLHLNIIDSPTSSSPSTQPLTIPTTNPTVSQSHPSTSLSIEVPPAGGILPSPPDSPSSDHSASSFPSVSSSFFFSSVPASPPQSQHSGTDPESYFDNISSNAQSDRDQSERGEGDGEEGGTQGLIIPSLTLPSALRRPTVFGKTVGDVRVLVLGGKAVANLKREIAGSLVHGNEDVVDVAEWEPADVEDEYEYDEDGSEGANVLRASTDWIEHRDAHGLEKFEASRNVEIWEGVGYEMHDDPSITVPRLLSLLHTPFQSLHSVLSSSPPNGLLANLVAGQMTPLWTCCVWVLDGAPTPLEQTLIDQVSPHIPIIVLPPLSQQASSPGRYPTPSTSTYPVSSSRRDRSSYPQLYETSRPHPRSRSRSGPPYPPAPRPPSQTFTPKLSSFTPANALALRQGIFRSPETLAMLRMEAGERFLWWREVERGVERIEGGKDVRASRADLVDLPASSPTRVRTASSPDDSERGMHEVLRSRPGKRKPSLHRDDTQTPSSGFGSQGYGNQSLSSRGSGSTASLSPPPPPPPPVSLIQPNQRTLPKRVRLGEKATLVTSSSSVRGWNKAEWEKDWEVTLSRDIARARARKAKHRLSTSSTLLAVPRDEGLRGGRRRASESVVRPVGGVEVRGVGFTGRGTMSMGGMSGGRMGVGLGLDPLHLPSLFAFSMSLVGPLKARLGRVFGFGMWGLRSGAGEREVGWKGEREREKRVLGREEEGEFEDEFGGEKEGRGRKRGGGMKIFGVGMALVGAFCAGIGLGFFWHCRR
ncbi:hypothetical protein JAAARDRAFT_59027 [Jaapia argillacea MUCL 33604]|uniref:Uncharacterized protein n=1 Tax=Jaapia argillacea MUCL 33604 TaxID=933084 RepID=A0A067Q2E8_9AGAM|nr:hypothetical protein JAAARDRAFT_59027 [Jaapia argillacea MUCL 33604]